MAGATSSFRVLLQNRDFAALWAAQLVSTIGDNVHRVALAALVYELTGSLTQTGIAFVATALPNFLFGLVAGTLVDRWDRRRVMIASDLLRIPPVLVLPLVAPHSLLLVYVLLVWVSTLTIIFRPAQHALLPAVVRPGELNAANSLTSVAENTSDVIGYPLAGVLIGALGVWFGSDVGLLVAFGLDGITYLISALLVLRVRTGGQPTVDGASSRIWPALSQGIAFVRSSPIIRTNTLVMLLGPLTMGAITPMLVGYAWEVLGGGEWEYALLSTAISIGAIVAGFWLGTEPTFRPGILLVIGLTVMGLSVMGMASTQHLWLALLLISGTGAGSMMVLIPSVTLVQRLTPNELLGRVFSLRATLIFGAIMVSNAIGGWAGETYSVTRSLMGSGLALVVLSMLSLLSSSIRAAPSMEPSDEPAAKAVILD